eukprot:PhM_4_TR16674/c0_g1_i1/m.80434/K02335/DPO1, polA; DNA polymerase I
MQRGRGRGGRGRGRGRGGAQQAIAFTSTSTILDPTPQITTVPPVFIPSMGRSTLSARATWKTLDEAGVRCTVVVEPCEEGTYRTCLGCYPNCDVAVLPDNGRGVAYARNYILEHLAPVAVAGTSATAGWFWVLDDDISYFVQSQDAHERRVQARTPVHANARGAPNGKVFGPKVVITADVALRVPLTTLPPRTALYGLEYEVFVRDAPPIRNSYVCVAACLCLNEIPGNVVYRGRVREDYDFALQLVACGCVVVRRRDVGVRCPQMGARKGGMCEYYMQRRDEIRRENNVFVRRWGVVASLCQKGKGDSTRDDVQVAWDRVTTNLLRDVGEVGVVDPVVVESNPVDLQVVEDNADAEDGDDGRELICINHAELQSDGSSADISSSSEEDREEACQVQREACRTRSPATSLVASQTFLPTQSQPYNDDVGCGDDPNKQQKAKNMSQKKDKKEEVVRPAGIATTTLKASAPLVIYSVASPDEEPATDKKVPQQRDASPRPVENDTEDWDLGAVLFADEDVQQQQQQQSSTAERQRAMSPQPGRLSLSAPRNYNNNNAATGDEPCAAAAPTKEWDMYDWIPQTAPPPSMLRGRASPHRLSSSAPSRPPTDDEEGDGNRHMISKILSMMMPPPPPTASSCFASTAVAKESNNNKRERDAEPQRVQPSETRQKSAVVRFHDEDPAAVSNKTVPQKRGRDDDQEVVERRHAPAATAAPTAPPTAAMLQFEEQQQQRSEAVNTNNNTNPLYVQVLPSAPPPPSTRTKLVPSAAPTAPAEGPGSTARFGGETVERPRDTGVSDELPAFAPFPQDGLLETLRGVAADSDAFLVIDIVDSYLRVMWSGQQYVTEAFCQESAAWMSTVLTLPVPKVTLSMRDYFSFVLRYGRPSQLPRNLHDITLPAMLLRTEQPCPNRGVLYYARQWGFDVPLPENATHSQNVVLELTHRLPYLEAVYRRQREGMARLRLVEAYTIARRLEYVCAVMEFTGTLIDPMRLQDISEQLSGIMRNIRDDTVHATAIHRKVTSRQAHIETLARRLETIDVPHAEVRRLAIVHPTPRQDTSTGRIATSNPCLQTLANDVREGDILIPGLRCAVVPSPGSMIVTLDYSNMELRVLAHLSQDDALCQMFRSGVDVHSAVAARFFNKRIETITPAERVTSKTLVFGILYGIGTTRLMEEGKLSESDAKRFVDIFNCMFPGVVKFRKNVLQEARANGEVRTLKGVVRKIPLTSSGHLTAANERIAFNTVVQGSAADVLKLALCELLAFSVALKPHCFDVLFPVHDEVVMSVSGRYRTSVPVVVARAVHILETCVRLSVPLMCVAKVGKDYGTLLRVPTPSTAGRGGGDGDTADGFPLPPLPPGMQLDDSVRWED